MMDIVATKHDKSTVGKTTQKSNTAAERDTNSCGDHHGARGDNKKPRGRPGAKLA
jgi:hypothetical protein